MIDLGSIPSAIAEGVSLACSQLDGFISEIAESWWPDCATGVYLAGWERFLKIVVVPGSVESERRSIVLSRINAVGGLHESWFYELAKRLGWHKVGSPRIELLDGQYLPFRVGISRVGIDTVYDDISYGATTITIRYEPVSKSSDSTLKSLFGRCRTRGTIQLWETL